MEKSIRLKYRSVEIEVGGNIYCLYRSNYIGSVRANIGEPWIFSQEGSVQLTEQEKNDIEEWVKKLNRSVGY